MDIVENIAPELKPYIADATEVITVNFVDKFDEIDDSDHYSVEFAHQQFGASELIAGYKGLSVNISYSNLTMFSFLSVENTGLATDAIEDFEPDNIREKILTMYPIDQQECLVEKADEFKNLCSKQNEFVPFGEQIKQFAVDTSNFVLYRVDDHSDAFDAYMCRIQTVTMWYIEDASYTDNTDPRFLHYILYEKRQNNHLRFAGYMSVYKYFSYPESERARVAHILIIPPYRSRGIGPAFLRSIYEDIRNNPKIVEITAESPANTFLFLRDSVDCVDCKSLPEFSPKELTRGFRPNICDSVRSKLKIGKVQCRRIYEILRYYYIKTGNEKDWDGFKADVTKRLERPFKRSKRDSTRLGKALEDSEMALVSTKDEEKAAFIEKEFNYLIEQYDAVINRLQRFEKSFYERND